MWWSRVGPLAAALRVVPPNHRLQATAGGGPLGDSGPGTPAAPDAER